MSMKSAAQSYADAQRKSEPLPGNPSTLLFDSTIASAWQAATVPAVLAGRALHLLPSPQLPKPDCKGKVAIVSGSNTGIGQRTALHLAQTGATVIMACRSQERGEDGRYQILRELKRTDPQLAPDIQVMEVDLLKPQSIRAFTDSFKQQYDRLDFLINNAGTNIPGVTDQGLDYVFGASYLGHFAMTEMLYDHIAKTEGARVVNLSSLLHRYGTMNWEDAAAGRRGSDNYFNALFHVYCDSKLAVMMYTQDLRARFAEDNVSATAFAVSPGNVKSDVWRAQPLWLRIPFDLFARAAFLSTDQGCHTSVMAALAPLDQLAGENGEPALYLQPYKGPNARRPFDVIGPFAGTVPFTASLPPNLEQECKKLRSLSERFLRDAEQRAPAFAN